MAQNLRSVDADDDVECGFYNESIFGEECGSDDEKYLGEECDTLKTKVEAYLRSGGLMVAVSNCGIIYQVRELWR